jgi:hypothetical protein
MDLGIWESKDQRLWVEGLKFREVAKSEPKWAWESKETHGKSLGT